MAKPEEFSAELAAAVAAEERAKKIAAKAQHRANVAHDTALVVLKSVLLLCSRCSTKTPLKQFELIVQFYDGRPSYSDDGWTYHSRQMLICPKCGERLAPPEIDGFRNCDIERSVKAKYVWYSDNERPSWRVEELLRPSKERDVAIREAEEKAQKLEAARKLLKEEGAL